MIMAKVIINLEGDHSSELCCDNPACGYKLPPGAVSFGPHLIG
jgi:hypothetical protein